MNFVQSLSRFVRRNNYFLSFLFSSLVVFIYFKSQQLQPSTPASPSADNARDFLERQETDELERSKKSQMEMDKYLNFYNLMGKAWTSLETLEAGLRNEDESFGRLVQSRSFRAREIYRKSVESQTATRANLTRNYSSRRKLGPEINVATVACSKSTIDVMVMLKSAVMFSRDAELHVIIFGDKTLPLLAESVLELKWTINSLGWDFTYELLPVWFPKDQNEEWKQMYALCATQRLFFSSLLPHIDSLIYLDADSIVMSNLTNFWQQFKRMNTSQVAGIAPNTEYPANGFYNLWSKIPYYGKRGLNAGILIMNLTRMRGFDFENKALATYTLYKENVQMADQDILNIMFHAFPEKLLLLECTYNFIWAHCGEPDAGGYERVCLNENQPGPICFCHSSLKNGIHVVHGNMGTFHKPDYPLFQHLYRTIFKFNLTRDSYEDLVMGLVEDFNSLDRPCFYLTGEKMYENAKRYFRNLKLIS